MCYKFPGPRCSYHAKKKLNASTKTLNKVGISQGMQMYAQLKEAVAEDELEYYSTPAGAAELESSIERGEDFDGTLAAKLDYCKANRKAMLAAIKAQDEGDTGTHEEIRVPKLGDNEFLKDAKTRKPWAKRRILGSKLENGYDINGENVAKNLNFKEMNALQWYAGDGFIHINSHLHQQNGTYVDNMHPIDKKAQTPYSTEKIKEAIHHLDSAFEKSHRNESVITYRGLKNHNFPVDNSGNNTYEQYAEETYKEGSIHVFPGYLSTSLDPAVAHGFSSSGVVMEIKAKSVIPTGFLSSWNSEKEILVQRDRKFKVIAVKKNIPYESQHNKKVTSVTVIQLEEI